MITELSRSDRGAPSLVAIERRVRQAMACGLPGVEAQMALAPRPRPSWTPGQGSPTPRPAAALLVLLARENAPHVVLTVRSGRVRHAGQVSLPGGAVDAGETIEAAALREAEEEIALPPTAVRVVGPLTPLHVAVSGFVLHPVAAICDDPPPFVPARGEVDRILEVPLAHFTDPGIRGQMPIVRAGHRVLAPYFDVEGEKVWGATAMILSELLHILDDGSTTEVRRNVTE